MDPPGLLPRAKRLGVGAQASVTRDAGDADAGRLAHSAAGSFVALA
jgi:hypothetical protein